MTGAAHAYRAKPCCPIAARSARRAAHPQRDPAGRFGNSPGDEQATYQFEKYREVVSRPLEPIRWLVKGLIAEQDRTVVYGEWGSFKTWLVLDLAMHLAAGKAWLGKLEIPRPFSVLCINEEDKVTLVRRRFKQLAMGADMEGADLPLHLICRGGIRLNEKGAKELLRKMGEENVSAEVILVETLRAVGSGDENLAKDVREFWRCLDPLYKAGKTVLITHHMRKPKEAGPDPTRNRASGSGDIMAGADGAISLRRIPRTRSIEVKNEKLRDAEEHPPFTLSLETQSESGPVRLIYGDSQDDAGAGANRVAAEEVVRFLEGQAGRMGTRQEILRHLAAKNHAQRTGEKALTLLQGVRLEKKKRGVYRLMEERQRAT